MEGLFFNAVKGVDYCLQFIFIGFPKNKTVICNFCLGRNPALEYALISVIACDILSFVSSSNITAINNLNLNGLLYSIITLVARGKSKIILLLWIVIL